MKTRSKGKLASCKWCMSTVSDSSRITSINEEGMIEHVCYECQDLEIQFQKRNYEST